VRLKQGGTAPLLPVPVRWLPRVEDEAVARVSGERVEVGDRGFCYGIDGLQKA
jgi:hypothetical protein